MLEDAGVRLVDAEALRREVASSSWTDRRTTACDDVADPTRSVGDARRTSRT